MRINPADPRDCPGSPFTVHQRAIFASGGGFDLRGDPLVIERRYDEAMADNNPSAIGERLKRDDPNTNLLAFRRLADATHAAPGTVPLELGGEFCLTADESLSVIGRFLAFRERLAGEYREEAEMIATYGPAFGGKPSYRQRCGLWWNRRRVQSIAAVATFWGITAAKGGPLQETMADALANRPNEALEMAEQYENDRLEAATRAAKGAGGP